jgi:tetratricopeptide (TPR) repeat protein
LDAKANAEHSDDDDIKGLIYSYIGQQYYMQRKYENAIGNFKLALEHFNKSQENYKRKIAVLNNIGNCFLLEGIKDSAMVHYNESIRLAETAQDSANVMHNLGMAYLSFNDADKAKQRLFHALNLSPDSASRSSIFLNLSKVYKKEKMMDSAIYFAKLSLQSVKNNDEYILANIYNTLSNMEKEKKNYEKAYEYYKQYNDYIIRINNERHNNHNNVQVIETRHDLDVLQRKNNNLTTKVIIGVLVLVIVGGIFFKYLQLEKKKVVRQRTKVVELNKEIAEQRRKIVELEQKLSDHDTDINNKKAELIKKEETFFKIMRKNIKKIALFDNYIDLVNNKINNEILSTAKLLNLQNEKTVLHDDINILYNDILNKTRIKYPVTEQKFKIICLICVDLDNYDIASILGIDKHIVEREKSEIRKILKIKAREDIKSFVLEDVKTIL